MLLRDGALAQGTVESLHVEDILERELSTSAHLRLTYAPNSAGRMPTSLFVKLVNTAYDDDDPLLATEIDYYATDYTDAVGTPIPGCYDAALSDSGSRYHLLLEDLSETHAEFHKKRGDP